MAWICSSLYVRWGRCRYRTLEVMPFGIFAFRGRGWKLAVVCRRLLQTFVLLRLGRFGTGFARLEVGCVDCGIESWRRCWGAHFSFPLQSFVASADTDFHLYGIVANDDRKLLSIMLGTEPLNRSRQYVFLVGLEMLSKLSHDLMERRLEARRISWVHV